jgi:hypothetical protein
VRGEERGEGKEGEKGERERGEEGPTQPSERFPSAYISEAAFSSSANLEWRASSFSLDSWNENRQNEI